MMRSRAGAAALAAMLAAMATLTAAEPLVLVSGYDPVVHAYALAADGALKPLAESRVGTKPSFLAVAPDGRFAWACDELEEGRMVALALDRASGRLTTLNSVSSGGRIPCHAALHQSGRWLFTANYRTGQVGVLPVHADGTLGEPVCVAAPGVQAHMAMPSPCGRFLYVPCKGSDRVVSFRIDAATGQLAQIAVATTAAGAGPRHLALAADGRSGWLVNELGSTIQPVALDGEGGLSLGAATSTLPAGWTGTSTGGGIVLADGGRMVIASNRGHDSLAAFRTGGPALLGHTPVGAVPRHVALDPGGSLVFTACQGADRVDILRLDAASGRMDRIGQVAATKPAFAIVLP